MSHVTGINLLPCVNRDGWQVPMDAIEVKKIDIYVLYVYGHKMTGHLIYPRSLMDGFIFFIFPSRWVEAPFSSLSSL